MTNRYIRKSNLFSLHKTGLFTAVNNKLKEGYTFLELRSDIMSGLVVALVAVPLAMALAIASGVAPQNGLYTVIIGGGLVALLGGSRFQVSGPTAAFVVILYPIVQKFGLGGLLVSGFLSGIFMVAMGYARMGRLIQFIPYPVTTGFTSGIAVVIAVLQVKDFLGLSLKSMPESFIDKLIALFHAIPTISLSECIIGFVTLAILLIWPKINKRVPAPLVALSIITIACALLSLLFSDIKINTIGGRFAEGIPQSLPQFQWPWEGIGIDGKAFSLNLNTLRMIFPSAFAIAMLGAIESLLSAVVADGMAHTKHDPDGELIALGIGNMICPFFGGIPATGAIARTTTNIRFGARSPFSAVFHAVFTLLIILLFAPYVSYLPMAALAALLMLVAYNMSEYRHFIHILKVAPRSDVSVLLICFLLTVIFDMVIGVSVGVGLAALLFMRRMAEVTGGHKLEVSENLQFLTKNIPSNIVIYEIEGPLFFGAAEKAAKTLTDITDEIKGVVFLLNKVPAMDVTGLVALEGAIYKLQKGHRKVCLVGLCSQPKKLIKKSKVMESSGNILFFETLDAALKSLE